MEFIHALTTTSSLCSGFTLGCVIYEHIHIKQSEYRPRNYIELLETLPSIFLFLNHDLFLIDHLHLY